MLFKRFANEYYRTPQDRRRAWMELGKALGFILAWPVAMILGNLFIEAMR